MYYDALSRNTVKITLTRKDMDDYSIRSECLRSRSAESKRSLTGFLKKFQSESSLFKGQKAERLFLEAFPSDDGGCIMYVSTLGSEILPPVDTDESTGPTVMCSADSFSAAARLCRCVSGIAASSALYRLGGRYFLIMTADSSDMCGMTHMISEFGELSDDATDIAYTTEHGSAVCVTDAAGVISRLI